MRRPKAGSNGRPSASSIEPGTHGAKGAAVDAALAPFETLHEIVLGDARDLSLIPEGSVHLVVTSPPYPMIEMWDELFAELAPATRVALEAGRSNEAFELMHEALDPVWRECHRVLVPGGFACINIGDATRTHAGRFRLHPNHVRATTAMMAAGFNVLPDILWRKPTNAPNKFLGSGMLPAGAYVTYEHESILVFRKGGKRPFDASREAFLRRRSAFFWEERNAWFSDVWTDLLGARQALCTSRGRERSAAFPFELPFRLIQMFSMQTDVVLDPFAGIGTTLVAAAASGRSSIGVERDEGLARLVAKEMAAAPGLARARTRARLVAHRELVAQRASAGKPLKHVNRHLAQPVMTRQEADLVPFPVARLQSDGPRRWRGTHLPMTREAPAEGQAELPFTAADGSS